MADQTAFFKVKSSKRSNPEARTTLDAIHSQKIQSLIGEQSNIQSYKSELDTLRKKLKETASEMESWRIERKIEEIEKKIKSLESNTDINDYFLRSGDILFDYYDMQDQINKGNSNIGVSTKAKPGSILAILGEVASEEAAATAATISTPIKQKKGRNELLNE